MRMWVRYLAAILSVLTLEGSASGQPPPDLGYQGRLLDSAGVPLEGPVNLQIRIFDQPSDGIQLYAEDHPGVGLADGVFHLLLGTGINQVGTFDAELFGSTNRWLEVLVNGEALAPRQPFSSVAYAFQSEAAQSATFALDADLLDGSDASAFAAAAHAHTGEEISSGTVAEARIDAAIARDSEVASDVADLENRIASLQTQIDALAAGSAPTGTVWFFALSTCPMGWSEFGAAQGRTLVGLPTGGTLQGSTGTPLGDLESRQHTHAVSTPTVGTSFVAAHAHTVPSRLTTTDTHNHRWVRWNGSLKDWISFNSSGGEFTITNWTNGMDQAGSGVYPVAASSSGSTTIYTDRDSHNHSVGSSSTGSSGAHNHTVTGSVITSSAANSSPTLPYVQLLVCVKD